MAAFTELRNQNKDLEKRLNSDKKNSELEELKAQVAARDAKLRTLSRERDALQSMLNLQQQVNFATPRASPAHLLPEAIAPAQYQKEFSSQEQQPKLPPTISSPVPLHSGPSVSQMKQKVDSLSQLAQKYLQEQL